jgi:hypothetical protein
MHIWKQTKKVIIIAIPLTQIYNNSNNNNSTQFLFMYMQIIIIISFTQINVVLENL